MGFRVLKFGGSSVADATAMSRVLDIVGGALAGGRVVLVSSAISGCTDTLIDIGHRAAGRDSSYKDLLLSLRDRHLEIASALLPENWNGTVAEELGELFDSLGSIVIGVTSFTPAVVAELMTKMENGFTELDKYSAEFDNAVAKLTNEQKLEYGFIVSNWMYLIRAFNKNDLFLSYVITVVEKVKQTLR